MPGSYQVELSPPSQAVVQSPHRVSPLSLPKLASPSRSLESDNPISPLPEIPSESSSPYSVTFQDSHDPVVESANYSPGLKRSNSYSSGSSFTSHGREFAEAGMYEGQLCTTTRTVIRPSSNGTHFGVFPTSFSKPSILSRHRVRQSVGLKPSDVLTYKPLNSFERELDARQIQWEREQQGAGAIQVFVKEERETFQEESWRSLIQEMHYQNRQIAGPSIQVLGSREQSIRRYEQ